MSRVLLALTILLICSPTQAKPVAPGFLIMPGKSIGKVALGDKRDAVHKKMGNPSKVLTEVEAQLTLSLSDYFAGEQCREARKQSTRKVTVDVWKRPKATGNLKVIYEREIVKQISVSLLGYTTTDGLSVASTFKDFWNKYKNPRDFDYDLAPRETQHMDSPPMLQAMYDYVSEGVAFFSHAYYGSRDGLDRMYIGDVRIDTIIVHRPGLLALDGYGVGSTEE